MGVMNQELGEPPCTWNGQDFASWKSTVLVGKSTNSMEMFNSYVKFPEGTLEHWKNKKNIKIEVILWTCFFSHGVIDPEKSKPRFTFYRYLQLLIIHGEFLMISMWGDLNADFHCRP